MREVEDLELVFRWEWSVLEGCTQRLYQMGRALLPTQRAELREILTRRGRGNSEAGEGD